MCVNYAGHPCRTLSCDQYTDCQWDPFCKKCRTYWYDNAGREGDGR